jgi:hypothetical protein
MPPKNPPGDGISDYGNTIVTGAELAAVLGLSESHIFTLKRRHIIQSIRARKNDYQLGPSIRSYSQYKCGRGDSAAEVDFHKERALEEKANRQLRQILVDQTKSRLHDCDDVRAIVEDSNNEIRSKLLAFAKRLALQITGKHDPTEVKGRIDSAVRELLTNLSKYRAWVIIGGLKRESSIRNNPRMNRNASRKNGAQAGLDGKRVDLGLKHPNPTGNVGRPIRKS